MKTRFLLTALLIGATMALQAQTTVQKDKFKNIPDDYFVKQCVMTETKGCLYIGKTNTTSFVQRINKSIRSAWMTNKGTVVIWEDNSVSYNGIVPSNVQNKLAEWRPKYTINNITFTDIGNVIICHGNGGYYYSLPATTTTQQTPAAKG